MTNCGKSTPLSRVGWRFCEAKYYPTLTAHKAYIMGYKAEAVLLLLSLIIKHRLMGGNKGFMEDVSFRRQKDEG